MLDRQKTWITGGGLRPFLRGVPFLSFHESRAKIHRLDPDLQYFYPGDTWEHARTPAGARLEFVTEVSEIRIRLRYTVVGPRPESSLWANGQLISQFEIHGTEGDHELSFVLPKSPDHYTFYLPIASVVEVAGIAPADGLEPAPYPRHLWLAYGDSITHGWHCTDPGLTYPAITARKLGIGHYNLGFAGAARGEAAVASSLGSISCDLITLAFGTNIMRVAWYDENTWRELFRTFIELVRAGHPDTPLGVISPIFRTTGSTPADGSMGAWSESTPNARGMTQVLLRRVEEEVVRTKQHLGDRNLHLLPGLELLGEAEASLLSDGIHPNDAGMDLIATRLAPRLATVLV